MLPHETNQYSKVTTPLVNTTSTQSSVQFTTIIARHVSLLRRLRCCRAQVAASPHNSITQQTKYTPGKLRRQQRSCRSSLTCPEINCREVPGHSVADLAGFPTKGCLLPTRQSTISYFPCFSPADPRPLHLVDAVARFPLDDVPCRFGVSTAQSWGWPGLVRGRVRRD